MRYNRLSKVAKVLRADAFEFMIRNETHACNDPDVLYCAIGIQQLGPHDTYLVVLGGA